MTAPDDDAIEAIRKRCASVPRLRGRSDGPRRLVPRERDRSVPTKGEQTMTECVPTWAEMRASLEAAGASEETMESLRRATAGARHACRVRRVVHEAIECARKHLAAHPRVEGEPARRGQEYFDLRIGGGQWWVGERERATAALLLTVELNGAGGPGGLGGAMCATERMPFARTWGRGRRHAADGAAWDAAAREALRDLARRGPGVYDAGLAPDRVRGLSRDRETVPARFALAIARASLLAVIEADLGGRTPALDVGGYPGDLDVEVAGTAAEWAAVCTEIEAHSVSE